MVVPPKMSRGFIFFETHDLFMGKREGSWVEDAGIVGGADPVVSHLTDFYGRTFLFSPQDYHDDSITQCLLCVNTPICSTARIRTQILCFRNR